MIRFVSNKNDSRLSLKDDGVLQHWKYQFITSWSRPTARGRWASSRAPSPCLAEVETIHHLILTIPFLLRPSNYLQSLVHHSSQHLSPFCTSWREAIPLTPASCHLLILHLLLLISTARSRPPTTSSHRLAHASDQQQLEHDGSG